MGSVPVKASVIPQDSLKRCSTGLPQTLARLVGLLLVALVLALPWYFGGAPAEAGLWSSWIVLVALAAWTLWLAVTPEPSLLLPVTLLPLLLAGLFGLGQVVPLNAAWLATLSPKAAGIWELTASGEAATASLYPAATRYDVARLVLAILVFLLGVQFFRTSTAQRWLWGLLAVNGATLAVFGIVQQLSWNGKLYWTVEPAHMTLPFGPYVNHNNAAGYLNMCLAGAIALTLGNSSQSSRDGSRRWMGWAGIACGAFIVAGLLASLSRGGFVAMLAAAVVVAVVSWRFWPQGAPIGRLAVAGILAAVLLGGAGLAGPVQSRLATLLDQHREPNERLLHWQEVLPAVGDFAATGSGLGTYRYVYQTYQSRPSEEWFYHAENQYLEAAVEGGLLGLGLMLATLALLLYAVLRVIARDASRGRSAFAVAGLFALVSQAVHAFFDFGLYLSANCLLLALIAGAIAGRACRVNGESRWIAWPAVHLRPAAIGLAGLFVLECFMFPLQEARAEVTSRSAVRRLHGQLRADPEVPPTSTQAAISQGEQALRLAEDNADLHRRLAWVWVRLYRQKEYQKLRNESPRPRQQLWSRTAPSHLRNRALRLAGKGEQEKLATLRRDPHIRETLGQAVGHFRRARQCCPLFPDVHLQLGELAFLVHDPHTVNRFLDPIPAIAPHRPGILYRAGRILATGGQTEKAFALWRASLLASDRYEQTILEEASRRAGFATVVAEVLPADPQRLIALARSRYADADQSHRQELLLRKAARGLRKEGASDFTDSVLQAKISVLRDDLATASEYLQRALLMQPQATEQRYRLARLLARQGRREEALQQAALCCRSRPGQTAYREFYRQLIRQATPEGDSNDVVKRQ